MDKKEICEYCGLLFSSKKGLTTHKRHKHNELLKLEINKRKERELEEREKDVVCMICGEKFDCINQHVFYKHKITLNDYKKQYPTAKLQKDKRSKKELHCPYCSDIFEYNNGLSVHIKNKHSEFYVKKLKENKEGLNCRICNKIYINLSQHIELFHNMSFIKYSEIYNYSGLKKLVTEEHKNNLSKNKLIFYNETKRGEELKKEQSEKILGRNNPSCRDDVRAKISRSAINRIDNHKYASRGIHVHFTYNNRDYRTRSFLEFKVLVMLLENNINFSYEKERIHYIDNSGKPRYYYPDLKIGDIYYEIKSKDNECILEEKYQIVFNLLKNFGKTIKMLSAESIAKEFKINLEKEDYYCDLAKKLLKDDKIRFVWYSIRHSKSRILEKISQNYLIDEKHFNVVLSKKNTEIGENND